MSPTFVPDCCVHGGLFDPQSGQFIYEVINRPSERKKMLTTRYSREFYKIGARAFSASCQRQARQDFQFLVVGGGAGGLSISSTLCRKYPHATAIIEPSEVSSVILLLQFCCWEKAINQTKTSVCIAYPSNHNLTVERWMYVTFADVFADTKKEFCSILQQL